MNSKTKQKIEAIKIAESIPKPKRIFSMNLVLQYIERDMARISEAKFVGLKSLEGDYDYFFRWYAEELMAGELQYRYLDWIKIQLSEIVETKKQTLEVIDFFVSAIKRQLEVYGSNILNSTSQMTNIHNVLKIQNLFKMQKYLDYFTDYINTMEEDN